MGSGPSWAQGISKPEPSEPKPVVIQSPAHRRRLNRDSGMTWMFRSFRTSHRSRSNGRPGTQCAQRADAARGSVVISRASAKCARPRRITQARSKSSWTFRRTASWTPMREHQAFQLASFPVITTRRASGKAPSISSRWWMRPVSAFPTDSAWNSASRARRRGRLAPESARPSWRQWLTGGTVRRLATQAVRERGRPRIRHVVTCPFARRAC